jgi:hypothetical protein
MTELGELEKINLTGEIEAMTTVDFDTSKTLDQLENKVWGPPNYDSHLVKRCHELRTVPIKDFGPEDLRIMLGQSIGVRFLLPFALEKLERDPLLSGDMYSGDLLQNVVQCDRSGLSIPSLEEKILSICARAVESAQHDTREYLADQYEGGAAAYGMTEENFTAVYEKSFNEHMKFLLPVAVLNAVEAGER